MSDRDRTPDGERYQADEELEGLELSLRAHYRAMPETPTAALSGRIDDAIAGQAAGRLDAVRRRWLRPAGYLMATVTVVAVVALGSAPLWYSNRSGPGPSAAGTPPTSPVASTETSPLATATATPARSPVPAATYDPAVLAAARAALDGRIRNGGFWAIQLSNTGAAKLLVSADGSAWAGHAIDVPDGSDGTIPQWPCVFVLDMEHAWSVVPGPGTKDPFAGQGSGFDHLRLVVNRTSDGGKTWEASTTLPGDYPDSNLALSFVDAEHGFLIASTTGIAGTSTILRTDDGGATWTVVSTPAVGTSGNLGSNFTATDRSTLWAGGQAEARPVAHQQLAVSRDGGRTWSPVGLGGTPDRAIGQAVPYFLDASNGIVALPGDPARYFRTSDGGATWSEFNGPLGAGDLDFVDEQHVFGVVAGRPPLLVASANGGASWTQTPMGGLPADQAVASIVFTDAAHGITGVGAYVGANEFVYATADGGRTWRPAPLGEPSAEAGNALDMGQVRELVGRWENYNAKGSYALSWEMLAPSQQAAIGSQAKWTENWQSMPDHAGWIDYTMSDPYRLTRLIATDAIWLDISAVADVSRAYGVGINHPNAGGASAGSEILALAPMKDGSGWRVWLVH